MREIAVLPQGIAPPPYSPLVPINRGNAMNVLGKTYVASCFSSGGCFYRNGRTVFGSLSYKW